MKKNILTLLLLIIVLTSSLIANAESGEWTCPECGTVVTGNFCYQCGAENPSSEWVCPNCGETVTGNFCDNCGTAKGKNAVSNSTTIQEPTTNIPEISNTNNSNTQTVPDWHNNLLKEEHGAKGELKADGSSPEPEEKVFGVDSWNRNQIKAVYVLDTLKDMPSDAVDISEAHNGSVMGWLDQNKSLYIAGNGGVMAPENSDALFSWMENATIIDLGGNLHTDLTTRMGFFFHHCTNLQTVNLDGIVTENVTSFTKMFAGCHNLKQIDLSGFNVQNATELFCMFLNCYALEELNLSSFNPSKVTDFQWMFRDCTSLKRIEWDPQTFSTASAENMIGMFVDCSSLEFVDVSMFDTSHVTSMYMMFSGCSSLKYIDTSHWDVSSVEKHGDMFAGAFLEAVYETDGQLLFR